MSSTEDSCQLKAGHPPAGKLIFYANKAEIFNIYFCTANIVKAGGMRITQHKTTHTERPPKDAEDVTGLTVSSRLVCFHICFLECDTQIY